MRKPYTVEYTKLIEAQPVGTFWITVSEIFIKETDGMWRRVSVSWQRQLTLDSQRIAYSCTIQDALRGPWILS